MIYNLTQILNMIKNFFKYCIVTSILVWLTSWVCFWQLRGMRWDNWAYGKLEEDFTYANSWTEALDCDGFTDLWNCTSVKEKNNTIIVRLLKVFGLDDSIEKERDLKFIDYTRAILNMALGLLAFIALIMTIYTFYMMFFTEDEDWAKKAKESLETFPEFETIKCIRHPANGGKADFDACCAHHHQYAGDSFL